MSTRKIRNSIILLFLDGFGLAPPGKDNPLSSEAMPVFTDLTGTAFTLEADIHRDGVLLKKLDAGMGVKGVPQSATGQTALLTGINAAEAMGFHKPAFPGLKLKKIIDKHNILKKVTESGLKATFANAYTPKYFKLVEDHKRTHSVTTLSVLSAGIPFRMTEDLLRGEAVYWDITNAYLKESLLPSIPLISPREAGRRLAKIGKTHSFTLFECFKPDLLGHKMDREGAQVFLKELDAFLGGIIEEMDSRMTLLLSSDHGNMENIAAKLHTNNPVPLFAFGPQCGMFEQARSITDVTPIILKALTSQQSSLKSTG